MAAHWPPNGAHLVGQFSLVNSPLCMSVCLSVCARVCPPRASSWPELVPSASLGAESLRALCASWPATGPRPCMRAALRSPLACQSSPTSIGAPSPIGIGQIGRPNAVQLSAELSLGRPQCVTGRNGSGRAKSAAPKASKRPPSSTKAARKQHESGTKVVPKQRPLLRPS